MAHCAYCKYENINLDKAIKCIGCGTCYHDSCSRKIALIGVLPNGAYLFCCGTRDEIERAKEKKLNKKAPSLPNNTIYTQQQMTQSASTTNMQNTKPVISPQPTQSQIVFELNDSNALNHGTTTEANSVVNKQYLNRTLNELWNKIENLITSNSKESTENFQRILDKKINPIVEKLDNQQLQIDEAMARINTLELNSHKESDHIIESTISELADRKRREANLIFFNVPDNIDQRKDKAAIEALFNGSEFQNFIESASRIGKRQSTPTNASQNQSNLSINGQIASPQPLKVAFKSIDCIQWIFTNMKTIKWNGITFTKDKSPLQRQHYRDAKTELELRKSNGESNLKIQTINGIPRVIDPATSKQSSDPDNQRNKSNSKQRASSKNYQELKEIITPAAFPSTTRTSIVSTTN